MTMNPSDPYKPDAERLAAYCDGEMDDAGERARLEAYLAAHPEAQAEVDALRRLKKLWDDTAPPLPSPATWRQVEARLNDPPRRPARPAMPRPLVVAAVAACVAAVWLLSALLRPVAPTAAQGPVLPVAQSDDVEIVHIEGDDLESIVVGRLPLEGILELAESGDIEVHSMKRHEGWRQPMVPESGRPMIYARLESEND